MKALKLVALGLVLFFAGAAQAQISVRFNLGVQPLWAPVGYDDTQYYYLPDVEAYYDVPNSMFIYYEGNSWVHRSYLPSRYRNYDLYNGYKVSMGDYRGSTPYYNHRDFRAKYANGRNRSFQKTRGERPGRGIAPARDFRQSNQVNRGRGVAIDKNAKRGDAGYDRRGIQRNQKSSRSNEKNKGNKDSGNGRDKR
jgi:hypothetical protein